MQLSTLLSNPTVSDSLQLIPTLCPQSQFSTQVWSSKILLHKLHVFLLNCCHDFLDCWEIKGPFFFPSRSNSTTLSLGHIELQSHQWLGISRLLLVLMVWTQMAQVRMCLPFWWQVSPSCKDSIFQTTRAEAEKWISCIIHVSALFTSYCCKLPIALSDHNEPGRKTRLDAYFSQEQDRTVTEQTEPC